MLAAPNLYISILMNDPELKVFFDSHEMQTTGPLMPDTAQTIDEIIESLPPLPKQTSDLEDTLRARGGRYGTLTSNGIIAQNLKDAMHVAPNWYRLTPDKAEALHQIASKISRILTGDPEYADNWHDIAGYATLVEKEINSKAAKLDK